MSICPLCNAPCVYTGMGNQNPHRNERIRRSKLSEKNPNWAGNKVGKDAVHIWIKRRLQRPAQCSSCSLNPAHDLANISQKYLRDFSDWEWLCRRCHMIKDGRMKNLVQYSGRKT